MKRRTFFSTLSKWCVACGAALGFKPDPKSIPNPDWIAASIDDLPQYYSVRSLGYRMYERTKTIPEANAGKAS